MAVLDVADSMNLRRDDPFNLFGGGGTSAALPAASTPPAAPLGSGSSGGDAILQALMKQTQDERAQMALDAKTAEEEDRKKRMRQMIPLVIASLVAGVAGGKSARESGSMNPGLAVFQGGLSGINAAKSDEEKRRALMFDAASKGNEARRTELFKALGDIAQERVKWQGKAQTTSPEHQSKEMNDFKTIFNRAPQSQDEFNQFLLGRRPASDQTTDKLAADIFQRYQSTGQLKPADKAILDTIVKMRSYPGLMLGSQMGMYNLPPVTSGMGGGNMPPLNYNQ